MLEPATLARPNSSRVASEISRCRVCGSPQIVARGSVEFYVHYDWPVYDCADCGCRFTRHDASAYDLLYRQPGSCYSRYAELSAAAKPLFERQDLPGLRAELSKSSRYRFVIDSLAQQPLSARLLEIGASAGHLTSYFILAGYDVAGVDISPTAVAAATAAFGDHFALAGDARIEAGAPYDAIYHTGTIGCVSDPVMVTHDLLRLLKPGGFLLFNAPNRDACVQPGQLWFDSAPPPDLVTMFRPGFWRSRFGDGARVDERVEYDSARQNFSVALRKCAGRKWRRPVPIGLDESRRMSAPPPSRGNTLWLALERAARKLAAVSGLDRMTPALPTEFGLFVSMQKK